MEEILDTYDINENFLGVKPRSFCHSENPGVYHKVVGIWVINNKNEILVQKRAITKKKSPGKWDMPVAGHPSQGESCLNCCIRETKEELGVKTNEKDFELINKFVNPKGWEFVYVYLLKLDRNIKDFSIQKEEVEEVKWLDFNQFKDLIYSENFCNHNKDYKDCVINLFKK